MSENSNINTDTYWNGRFMNDWEASDGPRQSRFFARLAIENLPSWLIEQIRRQSLTLADWGCAQGDGTDVWASHVDSNQLVGVDFSKVAIAQAARRYPAIRFLSEDWLDERAGEIEPFDVVFSSNTLEHFHRPYEVLDALSVRAKKAVILVLPYRELDRVDEHFYSFLPSNVPLELSNGFRLIWSRVIACSHLPNNTVWDGDQIFLVYAEKPWIDSLKLTLADCEIGQDDTISKIAILNQTLAERDGQIDSLSQIVAERDKQIDSLTQIVAERDKQIDSLTQIVAEREKQIDSLTQIVAERDKQIDSLTQIVAERDKQVATNLAAIEHDKCLAEAEILKADATRLNAQYYEILRSHSWRLTKPLRVVSHAIKYKMLNFKKRITILENAKYYIFKFRKISRMLGVREAVRQSYIKIRGVAISALLLGHDQKNDPVGYTHNDVRPLINHPNYYALLEILNVTLNRRGIIIYDSIIDWNFPLFQRPQQLARAFARNGFLVFYCTPNFRYDKYVGFHALEKNLYACHVKTEIFNAAEIEPIVIVNWPTSKRFLDSLSAIKKKVIYDHIDHIEILPDHESFVPDHLRLIKESAVVTVTADDLYREIKKHRSDVTMCPNGVDLEHFKNSISGYPKHLENLVRQQKPIIGYSGALAKWFDYELIDFCAKKRPGYNFLLLGHEHDASYQESGLSILDNVFRAGPVDYNVLPQYLKLFDVATVPFKINKITAATSPIKLFEYAACRKPIVTTALRECQKYKGVMISHSKEEFLRHLDTALSLRSDDSYLQHIDVLAHQNTWKNRADTMIKSLRKVHAYDVISFPIMPWSSRFQRSQQLLTKFASNGMRVFRINTTFTSAAEGELVQIRESIFHFTLKGEKNLSIYKDKLNDSSVNEMLRCFESLRRNHLISAAVCIVELPFWYPLAMKLKNLYGFKLIYDCMDEHEGFSTNEVQMLSQEAQLAKDAELVIVTAKSLFEKIQKYNSNCILIPNATDFEHFSYLPENDLLKGVVKPIIGYYGAISDWFDNALVEHMARSRRDWTIVLIGNTFGADISVLKEFQNVKLLGEIPYAELPKYLYWFDVCIIPFKLNKLTEATNPVKFFEYLSSGKPVVATRLAELIALQDYLYLADSKDDFVCKVNAALEDPDKAVKQRRIELAMKNTWSARYEAMHAAIGQLYPKVSIIIVTFNNIKLTMACIESIYFKSQYPNFELVIVDNNSQDGTQEYLRSLAEEHSNLYLIMNEDNRGFAAANNQGIGLAKGDYIILLNNDTLVTPGWITRLLRHLKDPKIGMVGPMTNMCGNMAKIKVSYNTTSLTDFDKFVLEYYKEHADRDFFEIDMLGMFCVAMRKETIDEIGLLDERFKVGTFEDTDYSYRLKLKNYKIICARDVFIHHHCNASFGQLPPEEYSRIYAQNRKKFEEKWGLTGIRY